VNGCQEKMKDFLENCEFLSINDGKIAGNLEKLLDFPKRRWYNMDNEFRKRNGELYEAR